MSIEVKIDKDIPMPNVWEKYPFDKMNCGDSIVIKREDLSDVGSELFGRADRKYITRPLEAGNVRCWRVY